MSIQNKFKTLIKAVIVLFIFLTGLFLGALWYKLWIFPFPQLSSFKLRSIAKKDQKLPVSYKKTGKYLHIPVEYLPNYTIKHDSLGVPFLKSDIGKAELRAHVKEVALVLVDTWETPQDSIKPDLIRLNQIRILEFCRNNEITIIHAPNHPVVQKYRQYHKLKNRVNEIIKTHDRFNSDLLFFMEWPSINNSLWREAQNIRYSGRKALYSLHPTKERDISRHLKPQKNEYILSSYMEFRYVLWKEKMTLLLYLGGALNECMQHRDTGINLLAGTDSRRIPFTIVILEDCSTAMGSPEISSKMAAKVMLDYFRFKIAFTANSKQLSVQKE